MIKRLVVLLLVAGTLSAFEDVSFSARSLGLGGDQAAVADDAFASTVNPALVARWTRPVVGVSSMPFSQGDVNGRFSYGQPVSGLGTVGGGLFYRNYTSYDGSYGFREVDTRLFLAVPVGRLFNFGASLGAYGVEKFAEEGGGIEPLPDAVGPIVTGGTSVNLSNFSLGLGAGHLFDPEGRSFFRWGGIFKPQIKTASFISLPLVAINLGMSGDIFKVHTGGEFYLFKEHLGLRAGINYQSSSGYGFSPTFGVTLRTNRVEKTDFEINYGGRLISTGGSNSLVHQFDLVFLVGDACKAEKDSILAAQAERARRLREEALARERDRLRAELDQIKKERAALERERADIERLRREALEEVGRIHGIGIVDTDSLINIILTEQAMRFDEGSVQIPFPQGYRTLNRVASFLYHYPNNNIVVEVHTDIPPPFEPSTDVLEEPSQDQQPKYKDAKALTATRARIIRLYFVEVKGMSASNITAKGAGDAKPVADNETEAGRAANRRVEITIVK